MRLMRRTACLALLCVALVGCNGAPSQNGSTTESKLKDLVKKDVKVGTGPTVEKGDSVWVIYKGTTIDGKEFDSNTGPSGMPYMVRLADTPGMSGVIKGWDLGLVGMKEGGERKLEIPYSLAYGEAGQGKIGPKTDLYFDITAVYVQKKGDEIAYDKEDVKVGAGAEAKKGDTVTFHYKGEYLNGNVFDDSEKRPSGSKPVTVKIDEDSGLKDKLIVGLNTGIVGMKEGGERKITLPPALVFGGAGNQTITGGQPVVFTVKLIKVGS